MTTESRPMNERRTRLWSRGDILAGIVAGLAGGAAMGLLAFVIAGVLQPEIGIWEPVKALAGVFYADALAQPGFQLVPVVQGVLVQALASAGFGLIFAILFRRVFKLPLNLGLPYLMGGVYGLAIWAATFIFLPWVNPVMADREKPAFLMAHLVYGVVLGLVYAKLHPRLERRG